MSSTQQLRFTIIATILCVIFACPDDDLYVIRSGAEQNLVLDGSNSSAITLQYYTNSSSQHWKLQQGDKAGLFYIINDYTGKALDLGKENKELVLNPREEILRQQWSLTLNGRIINSIGKRNVDVQKGKYNPGTLVILWKNNGNQAQEFVWTKVNDANSTESTETTKAPQ